MYFEEHTKSGALNIGAFTMMAPAEHLPFHAAYPSPNRHTLYCTSLEPPSRPRPAPVPSHPAAYHHRSGTMGNLIAVGAHCRRGDEIILGSKSHIFNYEATGASAFMGVAYQTIENLRDGGFDLAEIEGAVRGDDQHYPR